jgi:hypothetical protein
MCRNGVDLILGQKSRPDGRIWHAEPLVFKEKVIGMPVDPDSIINLSDEEAKNLMDELWQTGVRPSSGEGNAGQLGATEKHLNDMRKIVSSKLEVDL